MPFTPRAKKVLQLAVTEAQALNHTYVGTEHILLGLLHEGEGVAAQVLRNLNVDLDTSRAEIMTDADIGVQLQSPAGLPMTHSSRLARDLPVQPAGADLAQPASKTGQRRNAQ